MYASIDAVSDRLVRYFYYCPSEWVECICMVY